jgi:hypothetical protein
MKANVIASRCNRIRRAIGQVHTATSERLNNALLIVPGRDEIATQAQLARVPPE